MDTVVIYSPAPGPASFALTEPNNSSVEVNGATGAITLTITAPAAYVGTYTTDVNSNPLNVSSLPQCAVAPVLTNDGTPAVGEVLTTTPGLWIANDTDGTVVRTYERGGVTIPEQNEATYTIVSADQGSTVTMKETLGGVSVSSAGTVVPAPTRATDASQVVWYASDDIAVTGTDVTSINDKTGGGKHLNTLISSATANPQYDATSGGIDLQPANNAVLVESGAAGERFIETHIINAAGEVVQWLVFDTTPSTAAAGMMVGYGPADSTSANQTLRLGLDSDAGNDRISYAERRFSDAINNNADLGSVLSGKHILRVVTTQTEVSVFLDGAEITGSPFAYTLGNAPNGTAIYKLGGRGQQTTGGTAGNGGGRFFEWYVSSNTAANAIAGIEADIAAQYGITLA